MRIKVLVWPPQSPDMNPIENLWRTIKIRLAMNPSKIKNKDDMWAKFEVIWNEVSKEDCRKLIDSMPERVQALLRARGGHTRY